MTSKEIVELLCELVDLKELTNRGLILKDINNFQDQLEKDLEVLEIIKKRSVDVYALKYYICCYHNDNDALENYNKLCFEQETLSYDEYNLLKECLVNEK